MTFRHQFLPLLLAVCLCYLPAFAVDLPLHPRPNLLNHSEPIVDLAPVVDVAAGSYAVLNDPLWLSGNMFLAHARMGDGFFENPYQIDLERHRITPLAHLNEVIHDCKPAIWALSSDHHWILWRRGRLEPTYDFVATRLDGSKSVHWTVKPADAEGPYFWQPGTHRWVHLLLTDGNTTLREAQVFDLDHPHRKQVIPLPHLSETNLLDVLPDGSVLLTEWVDFGQDANIRALHVAKLRLRQDGATVRKWTLPVPGKGILSGISLSPDGKHVAWLIQGGAILTKPCGYVNPKWATLYITNTNGRHLRVVGTVPFTQNHDASNTVLHGWFPDNKRVLLQFRTGLYIATSSPFMGDNANCLVGYPLWRKPLNESRDTEYSHAGGAGR
jgi:hypothetical protein